MKKVILKIIGKINCSSSDLNSEDFRAKVGMLEGSTSIVINSLLFLVKIFLGILIGSVALIADAFHTLSDVLTSLVIFISFKISAKAPDEVHPFGHGRMEAAATLIVAVLMIAASVELFEKSFARILHPQQISASFIIIFAVMATVVVKEGLAEFSRGLGRAIDSIALEADFWHHRIDAISSLLVILALLGQRFGMTYLDGVAGILVALLIGYTGWDIAKKGVDEILGTMPNPDFVKKVKGFVKDFPDVYGIHDMVIHQYGRKIILSFHIEAAESMSFKEVHNLSDRVEKAVNKKFNTYSTIHADPVNLEDEELKKYCDTISALIKKKYEESLTFHDVRLVKDGIVNNLLFDIQFSNEIKPKDLEGVVKYLKSGLFSRFPKLKDIIIEIEPGYAL